MWDDLAWVYRVVEDRRTKEDGGSAAGVEAGGVFGERLFGKGRGTVECDAIARWRRSRWGIGWRRKRRVLLAVLAVVELHQVGYFPFRPVLV